MKTKIIFCNHFARLNWLDGAEVSLLQIIDSLPDREYQKYLVTPSNGQMPMMASKLGIKTFISPLSLMWTMGGLTDLDSTPYSTLKQHLNHLLAQENAAVFRLKRYLRQIQPDLLLTNTGVNVIPAVVAKKLGIKVIWFPREYWRGSLSESGALMNQYSDLVLVASEAMFELLNTIPALQSKLIKIPNFINLARLDEKNWPIFRHRIREQYQLDREQVAICFWGSISIQKGSDDFLLLAQTLCTQYQHKVKFFMVGNAIKDSILENIKAQIQRMGLQNEIILPGFFSDSQQILPAMDILVLPSKFVESFSRSALDGMTFGKPVLAYDGGGIKDLIIHKETGYLAPKGSLSKLVAYCSHLIAHPDWREKLGRAGRQRVETCFSAQIVQPILKNALERLIHY